MSASVVAVAGSRTLPASAAPLVAAVCRSLVASGRSLVVGCAVGADAAVLSAVAVPGCSSASSWRGVPAARVHCLAAFGPGGAGSCPVSAVAAVQAFAAAGGSVSWWAGGGAAAPLRARLAARTAAVVSQASAGCVVFFASPASRGSLLAARLAVGRGLPVFGFPVGFSGGFLPSLGAGLWVPVSGVGVWVSAWSWIPSQQGIF